MSVNIDALLQTTWLKAIRLRNMKEFKEGEGRLLWNRCVKDIIHVQTALEMAKLDEESRQHILYAQCALLDEVVTGRNVQDDAFLQWNGISLQKYFLGITDAGNELCDRMWKILHDPTAHSAVLTCFQRVLLLGFLGKYQALYDLERGRLVKALNERLKPVNGQQKPLTQRPSQTRYDLAEWLTLWPTRLGLGVLALGLVWLGYDYWLM